MSDSKIIVALDFPDDSGALALIDRIDPDLCRLKIGKELFTRCGPDLVRKIVNQGYDVFLDLKYHDIPNTVANACKAAADLGERSSDLNEMEMAVLCAVAYHQPIDRAGLADIFGKEVSRDLLARLRYKELITNGPRAPRAGAPHTGHDAHRQREHLRELPLGALGRRGRFALIGPIRARRAGAAAGAALSQKA